VELQLNVKLRVCEVEVEVKNGLEVEKSKMNFRVPNRNWYNSEICQLYAQDGHISSWGLAKHLRQEA
jgi:hypothetical protein